MAASALEGVTATAVYSERELEAAIDEAAEALQVSAAPVRMRCGVFYKPHCAKGPAG